MRVPRAACPPVFVCPCNVRGNDAHVVRKRHARIFGRYDLADASDYDGNSLVKRADRVESCATSQLGQRGTGGQAARGTQTLAPRHWHPDIGTQTLAPRHWHPEIRLKDVSYDEVRAWEQANTRVCTAWPTRAFFTAGANGRGGICRMLRRGLTVSSIIRACRASGESRQAPHCGRDQP